MNHQRVEVLGTSYPELRARSSNQERDHVAEQKRANDKPDALRWFQTEDYDRLSMLRHGLEIWRSPAAMRELWAMAGGTTPNDTAFSAKVACRVQTALGDRLLVALGCQRSS